MEKNKVKITVCGNDFIISSEDSQEYMRGVAAKVDNRIAGIMQYQGNMATFTAAIFAALEFCDETQKAKEAADNLREQIKSYLEDAAHAKNEAAELRRKIQSMTRELNELRAKFEK